jgi:hypothetical protein
MTLRLLGPQVTDGNAEHLSLDSSRCVGLVSPDRQHRARLPGTERTFAHDVATRGYDALYSRVAVEAEVSRG